MEDTICKVCEVGKLVYVATLGAPGVGQLWRCSDCLTSYHKRGRHFNLMDVVSVEDLVTHEFDNEHNGILEGW